MRRLLTTLAVLTVLAFSAAPARAQFGPLQGYWSATHLPYGILAHSDGTIWVGTTNSLDRHAATGALLGTVSPSTATAWQSMAEAPNGDVVALDYWNRIAVRFTSAGAIVRSFPLTHATREGGRVAIDAAGRIYVLTRKGTSSSLVQYDEFGNELAAIDNLTLGDGLALVGDRLYASDIYFGGVTVYDLGLNVVGGFNFTDSYATGLAADRAGHLLQPDYYGYVCTMLSTSGTVIGAVGGPSGMVPGFPYNFWRPSGAAQSPAGSYFVIDGNTGYVLVFGGFATPTARTSWGALKASYR